jgi:hypothetical protein
MAEDHNKIDGEIDALPYSLFDEPGSDPEVLPGGENSHGAESESAELWNRGCKRDW